MITKITNSNAQLYRVLFDKAADALRKAKPASLNEAVAEYFGDGDATAGWEVFGIGSLDEYYAYLQDLVNITGLSDDEKRFFVRLPLDEDVFAIDANSRSITVPSSFARNGVGVQGDEMAEILYFTVDRYFDAQDLANSNINIAIQWEAKNANKEAIAGFSRNFGKDIESIPGKIIFGWPISSELTEADSTIKFAVRFYTISEDENHEKTFTYSFATLPAEISINKTIVYDVTDTTNELDHGKDIINRINSDGIHNASMPIPGEPVITLEDITTDNKIYAVGSIGQRIVDLPGNENGVDLAVAAKPTAADNGTSLGVIGYKWKQYSYAGNGTYNTTFSLCDDVSVDYIEMTKTLEEGYDYYSRSGIEGAYTYTLIDNSNLANMNFYYSYEDDGDTIYVTTYNESYTPEGYSYNGNYIPLYKKISKANVNQTGIYTVDISAKILANTTTKEMSLEDGIKIPGPLTPVVTLDTATATDVLVVEDEIPVSAHIVANEGDAVLKVSAITGEAKANDPSKNGANPQVTLAYDWKVINDNVATSVEDGNGITYTDEDTDTLTIAGLATEDLDVSYKVTVTSTRNGVSTSADSNIYRITGAPVEPVIKVRKIQDNALVWVAQDYNSDINQIPATLRNGKAALTVRADADIQHDTFSYYWMKLKVDESDIEEIEGQEQTIYQIDLANDGVVVEGLSDKILTIFADKTGDPDDLIPDGFDTFADVIPADENVQNDVQNYQTTYEATEPGIYYCLIVNNLNQHINANASPFFVVQ